MTYTRAIVRLYKELELFTEKNIFPKVHALSNIATYRVSSVHGRKSHVQFEPDRRMNWFPDAFSRVHDGQIFHVKHEITRYEVSGATNCVSTGHLIGCRDSPI